MMSAQDPFAELFGEGRGQARADSEEQGSQPLSRQESGVSSSGLRFQAVSNAEVTAAIQVCIADIGHAPTRGEYELWRREADLHQSHGRRLPSSAAACRRFKSWQAALRSVRR